MIVPSKPCTVRREPVSSLAVLYVDLDGFKTVNDSLGHDAGDEMLRVVAARLLTAVRSDETVARLGGDEFAILIEASTAPMADAGRLSPTASCTSLATPFDLNGTPSTMSASIGIAGRDERLDGGLPGPQCRHRDVPGEDQRQGAVGPTTNR